MTQLRIAEIRIGAQRISDLVRLDQVYLVASEFRADSHLEDDKYHVSTSLRVSGERESDEVVIVSSRHELIAHTDRDTESSTPASWTAVIDYEARYVIVDELGAVTEQDYTCFAIDVATDILHPFARELVQSLTSRSPFPAFTMGRSRSIWEKDADDLVEIGGAIIDPAVD